MPSWTILLDVEGTTTPINFVYQVLFPYARVRMRDFLARHLADGEVHEAILALFYESAKDENTCSPPLRLSGRLGEEQLDAIVAYCHWLMDQDRKLTPLKTIQGKIWEEGYLSGELKGQVFSDVAPNLRRWHRQGRISCIYSSGSVLAQRLLFAHTREGDLTEFIHGFFDTNMGHKTEPTSYLKIAEILPQQPSDIVFISDVTAELDAAATAGFQTLLCMRSGNNPQPSSIIHAAIHTFDEVPAV